MKPLEIAPEIYLIDCLFAGFPRQCASFLISGEKNALVDTGPSVTADNLMRGLDLLGIEDLEFILLTHFHLDHAGAAPRLLDRFPDARVLVDERSTKYMVSPERLVKSAAKALGRMAPHYGSMEPVPEERIAPLEDGQEVDLGDRSIKAIHAPGHSGGHFVFLEEDTRVLFCGDSLGHYIEESDYIYPATPPPEFDSETSIATARKIAELEPDRLLFPHFGSSRKPEETIEQFIRQVRRSIELGEELDPAARTPRALAEQLFGDMPPIGVDEKDLILGILEVNSAGVLHCVDETRGR